MNRARVAFLIAFTLPVGCATTPVVDGADLLAVTDCTLIDGTGAPAREGVTILVQGNRILQIVDSDAIRLGPGVRTVSAAGQWVLPGYIDTHAHLPSEARLASELQTLLDYGITAARSPATDVTHGMDVRARLESGELVGPRFRMAGGLIDGAGSMWEYAAIVSTPDEMRAEVRRQALAGVDFIKLYSLLSPELVAAGIDAAHAHGLKVIGHLGRTSWLEALDLGIDALTHSGVLGMAASVVTPEERGLFSEFFMPNDWSKFDPGLFRVWASTATDEVPIRQLGKRLAQAGTILDPTLALHDSIVRGDDRELYERLAPPDKQHDFHPIPYYAYWSEAEQAGARSVMAPLYDIVRILHEEGAFRREPARAIVGFPGRRGPDPGSVREHRDWQPVPDQPRE